MEMVEAPTILPRHNVVVSPCETETKQLYVRDGATKRREAKIMENHYYDCIYEVLQDNRSPDEKFVTLNRLLAKIINLQCPPAEDTLRHEHNKRRGKTNALPRLAHLETALRPSNRAYSR